MPTQARDLISTGIPAASGQRTPFQPTGGGSLYTPPSTLVSPTVPQTPPPGPTPSMPTTEVPHGWSESGLFQGSKGITFPEARIFPIRVHKLSGATDIYAASQLITFPFVLRGALLWVPASAIGASSDGDVDMRIGFDNAANATAFNSGVSIFYPQTQGNSVYCPQQINLGPLWLPWQEGHCYITAHAFSLGGATNVDCVCMAYISPLDDYLGA